MFAICFPLEICVVVVRYYVLVREPHLKRKSPQEDLKQETYRKVVL